jgi:MFS family permease
MGLFITNVDVAVVNVATPSIHERLNASGIALQFVVSGYVLSYAMLLITGARLGDIHGYRRLFLSGLGLFTLASLGCGLAPDAGSLIAARVIQGIGGALMVPQALIGIQLNFFGDARARALGLYSVALSLGAVAGQVAGGVLVSADLFDLGWRPIFLINLPIGVALFAAALKYLPADPGGRPRQLDLWGVATLSATVLLALPPLMLGPAQHWPLWIWLSLAVSLVPLMAFIIVERRIAARGETPLISLNLIGQPAIAWALAALAAASMTYFALLFTLALYLQQGLGRSALYSGCALISWVAAFGVGGPAMRHLPARLAPLVGPFGYFVLAAAYLAISACLFVGYSSAVLLFTLLGFGGFGLGIGFTANIRHLTSAVTARHAPDMSGIITTNSQIAGVTGVATFGTAYLNLAAQPGPAIATHAFAIVVAACAIAALFATIAVYRSSHATTAIAAEAAA